MAKSPGAVDGQDLQAVPVQSNGMPLRPWLRPVSAHSAEDMSRVRSLLGNMKIAWGIDRIQLQSDALIVWVDPDDTTHFPAHIYTVPVEIRIIGEDDDPLEMAA